MGSRKSQTSMLSSREPLMIWKSSNCRLCTESECSCDKRSERNISHGPCHTNQTMTHELYRSCNEQPQLYLGSMTWSADFVIQMCTSLLCHTNTKGWNCTLKLHLQPYQKDSLSSISHYGTLTWRCTTEAVSVGSKRLSRISRNEMVEWDTGMEYSNDICPKLIVIKVH